MPEILRPAGYPGCSGCSVRHPVPAKLGILGPMTRRRVTLRAVTASVGTVVGSCALLLTSCTTPHASSDGGYSSHAATFDGVNRTWDVYTPESGGSGRSDEAPLPVVLVIHGTGDTGAGIRSGIGRDLERLADRDGFIVAYVDGYANNWNECRAAGEWPAKQQDLDDVGLMRHVVETIHGDSGDSGDSDASDVAAPVYAIGYSSGAHMAQRLAYEAPDLVSAVASVNANVPVDDNFNCTDEHQPVPILFLQGREDPINPFDGGEVLLGSGANAVSRGNVRSAEDSAEWFAQRNGIEGTDSPTTVRDGDAEVTTWGDTSGGSPSGPPDDSTVRLIAVDHSGHSFPTSTGSWGNSGGARYDGPGAIWDFFKSATS